MFNTDPKITAAPDGIKPDIPPLVLYDSGRVHKRYTLNDAGRIEGLYEEFYNDEAQTLKHRVSYADGLMHGPEELRYPDGTLFQTRASVEGWYDGVEERFFSSGVLRSRFRWKRGAMVGYIQHFHESGVMKSMEFMDEEGKRDMCEYSFDATSRVTRLAVWNKGDLALEQLYSADGAVTNEKRFASRGDRGGCVVS